MPILRRIAAATQHDRNEPRDGRGWPALALALVIAGGVAGVCATTLAAPVGQRRLVAALGLVVLTGQVGALLLARAGAAVGWAGLVALLLLAGPWWAALDGPVWALALPVVAAPAMRSGWAGATALGLAAAAVIGVGEGGAQRWLAGGVLLAVGWMAAAQRRRGEAREAAQDRGARELAAVREQLRRVPATPPADDRLVAAMRDNQMLRLELERGKAIVEQAVDASRTKASFLSTISHELRTPLNAIVGYTELLLERAESAEHAGLVEQRDDLARVQVSAKHLLGLVDGVLDLARLEAGKFEVQIEAFALDELLHEVVAAALPEAERAGNALKLKLPYAPLGQIVSDRARLRQVLVQLLGNACKFTQGGQIEVRAEPGAHVGVPAFVLSVRDTGVGIDADYLPQVFTPFSQADDSPTRRVGGLGVGLALCKHHCTLLGGEISVESAAGRGTTFRVVVPAVSRDPREAGVALISSF